MPLKAERPKETAQQRADRIKKDIARQNRACGTSGVDFRLLPPVIGYEGHDITKYRNPAHSFTKAGRPGAKRPPKDYQGSEFYNPGSYNRFGPKSQAGVKLASAPRSYMKAAYDAGPASYGAPNLDVIRRKAPEVSLKGKLHSKVTSDSPGPAHYDIDDTLLYPQQPRAHVTGRPQDVNRSSGPGVGAYKPNYQYVAKKVPEATITARREMKHATSGPGPKYLPETNLGPSPPAFSITGRPDPCIKPFIDKGVDDALLGEYVPNPQRIPIH